MDVGTIYERIKELPDRVLPVAEDVQARIRNHIADPPLPVGDRGITRWRSPDVVRRHSAGYVELLRSPSHGFNLCLVLTVEGLKDPAKEILGVVDYLGPCYEIVNVHMRNIREGLGNFQEVYVDNGDMNFIQVDAAAPASPRLRRTGHARPRSPACGPGGQRPGLRVSTDIFWRDPNMLELENA